MTITDLVEYFWLIKKHELITFHQTIQNNSLSNVGTPAKRYCFFGAQRLVSIMFAQHSRNFHSFSSYFSQFHVHKTKSEASQDIRIISNETPY